MDKKAIESGFSHSISHDQIMPYSIQVSDRCIDDNRKFFQSYFKEFVDSDGRIGVSTLLMKGDRVSIDDFVKNHIMNAVLYLNPKNEGSIK